MLSDQASAGPTAQEKTGAVASVIILIAIASALVVYKSSTALRALHNTAATGSFVARADLIHSDGDFMLLDAVVRSGRYLLVIWPALTFGILLAGAVRAFVSPWWLARLFRGGGIREDMTAGIAGAPLMLCSCCVAPVFSAVRERSGRVGPALAVALAAPLLNPAALVLTYMLFQPRIAMMRLLLACAAVFVVAPAIARLVPATGVMPIEERSMSSTWSFFGRLREFVVSSGHIAVRTVPLLAIGVVAAMWLLGRLPASVLSEVRPPVATALIAFFVVPVALPTFFEIPLALTLLSAGAPAGVAVALLFAGPAVNLASLLAIGRSAGWRLATSVGLAVAVLGCVGGLIVEF